MENAKKDLIEKRLENVKPAKIVKIVKILKILKID
jgi:hypothetical protein